MTSRAREPATRFNKGAGNEVQTREPATRCKQGEEADNKIHETDSDVQGAGNEGAGNEVQQGEEADNEA
ncbi:hypothetical protein BJ508DRAFT_336168 [Ascobolus immersus RN42]|uniref:Uncharacterized protein n=1 Tax=Ascobolus immersus RN42 TaxID=1160509 RepID=A0A3N4HDJ1_ASCIM|nr:hypothetical protein BJ508DRAFT_336168 [Ascobolus immersus RN42]